MQVILKESIRGKGRVGQIVEVADGFARNYLCPQGKAMPVNASNIEQVKAIVAEVEKKEKQERTAAEKVRDNMAKESFSITAKVKDGDALYGSLNVADVQHVLAAKGFELDKRQIHLIGGAIKTTGTFEVKVDLYHDISAEVTLTVVAEDRPTADE